MEFSKHHLPEKPLGITLRAGPSQRTVPGPQKRHLLHIFPSFGLGGVPIRICDVANRLGARCRHTIVALDNCFDARTRLDPLLEVTFSPLSLSRYGLIYSIGRYRRLIRTTRPDLLLTYNWGAVECGLANWLNPVCPHLHFESGFGVEEAEKQITRRVLFRRSALARVSRLIVPSLALVEIATQVWRFDPGKVLHIPNGVDCDRYATTPGVVVPWEALSVNGSLTIGTVAPLRAEKNLGRLLEVFATLGEGLDAHLAIVGDGPERSNLQSLAENYGISDRTTFAGHVENVQVALGSFDIFALSSNTEQMPNSVLQAMAAGRPIAALDVGDVKRMVAPENREFITPKGDQAAFIKVLKQLIESRQLRHRLGRANQCHVRAHYSLDRMVDAYRALFDEF